MATHQKPLELGEESIVDDDDKIIVILQNVVDEADEEDTDCIECVDYFQEKMICFTATLIIGTILLVFAYSLKM